MKRQRFAIYVGGQYAGTCLNYIDAAVFHSRKRSRVINLLPVELCRVVKSRKIPFKRWLAGREITL